MPQNQVKRARPILWWLLGVSALLFLLAYLARPSLTPLEEPPAPSFSFSLPATMQTPKSAPVLQHINPEDLDQLRRLVEEMLSSETAHAPRGAMRLYSYAFAGYALISAGRASPSFREDAQGLLDALIEKILQAPLIPLFSTGKRQVAGHSLSSSVVVRGHLSLLLLGRRSLSPLTKENEAILHSLMLGLAQDLSADSNHLLPSYDTTTYPADNELAATALSLYLSQVEADEVVQGALTAISGSLDALEAQGLPASEVSPDTLAALDVPRGCALSWSIGFRAQRDKASARRLYARYKEVYWVSLGPVVGFREWPRGVERAADGDSGPIILGIGSAASALGMIAARLTDEEKDYQALFGAAYLAGLAEIEAKSKGSWVERSIAIYAKVAHPWSQ